VSSFIKQRLFWEHAFYRYLILEDDEIMRLKHGLLLNVIINDGFAGRWNSERINLENCSSTGRLDGLSTFARSSASRNRSASLARSRLLKH